MTSLCLSQWIKLANHSDKSMESSQSGHIFLYFGQKVDSYVTSVAIIIANDYGHVVLRVLSTSFPLKRSHTMPVKAVEVSAN